MAESAFGGNLKSGGRFCVGRNLASVAVKTFSRFIYFANTFYELCTFNAICKNNAAINCITVPLNSVNFEGSDYASYQIFYVAT
jgi:hypothetical protein